MKGKGGFTLLEAIAVIGITALTLSLMYSVGMRGAFTGFRLGNRALATADSEIAKLAYRDVIASLVIPPVAITTSSVQSEEDVFDESFVGSPTEVAGYYLASRDTPCAPVGSEGRLTLTFEGDEVSTTVLCSFDQRELEGEQVAEGTEPVELVKFRFGGAAFSFSEDGTEWLDGWLVERGLPVETQILPNGELRQVYIRLATADDRAQMITLASSGRSIPQTAPAAQVQAQQGGGGQGQQGGQGGQGQGGRGGAAAGPTPGPPTGAGGGGRGGRAG